MSPALTILLITSVSVPVGENGSSDDPFTPAVVHATHEALGPDTEIILERVDALPSDDDAVTLGTNAHADAVVEVVWSSPEHLQSTIRVEQARWRKWVTREIGFRSVDEPEERSRTVGFAIASMLPERPARPEPSVEPPAKRERDEDTPPVQVAAPPFEVAAHASSLSATAVVAFGVGNRDGGFGGILDYRRTFARRLAVRLALGARVGDDPPADVATRFFYSAAGVCWTTWSSRNDRATLGFRLDALLALNQFVHRSPDSASSSKYKLMPGGDLLVEAGYFLSPGAALVVAGGAETVLGHTSVIVDGQQTATLGPWHPLVEAGLRVGF